MALGTNANQLPMMARARPIDWIGPPAILSLLVIIGLYRVQFGYDLSDESYYAVTGQRHALGDVPFRDTIDGALLMFDLLLWRVFALWPDVTFLELRILGLAILLLAYMSVYQLLVRFIRPFHAACACAAGLFAIPYGLWVPAYNLIFLSFTLIGLSMWLSACYCRNHWCQACLSLAAGAIWCVGCFCYVPMGISVFPVAALAGIGLLTWRVHDPLFRGAAWVVAGMACVASIVLIAFWRFDLVDPLLRALEFQRSAQFEFISLTGRIVRFVRDINASLLRSLLVTMAYVGMATVVIRLSRRITSVLPYVCAILFGMMGVMFVVWRAQTDRPDIVICTWLMAFSLTIHLWVFFTQRQWVVVDCTSTGWAQTYVLFLGVSGLCFLAQSYFSGMGFISGLCWTGPLLALGLAMLFWQLESANEKSRDQGPPAVVAYLVASIACCGLAIISQYSYFYREAPFSRMTTAFSIRPLRGIKSTPERVNAIEEVVAYLSQRLSPGDKLLAYKSSCVGLNYLTETRPALKAAWISDGFGPGYFEQLIGDMVSSNHSPRFCVRAVVPASILGNPDDTSTQLADSFGELGSPLHSFVREHYFPIKTIYPFQIWQHEEKTASVHQQRIVEEIYEDFSAWDEEIRIGSSERLETATHLQFESIQGEFTVARKNLGIDQMLDIRAEKLVEKPIEVTWLGRLRRTVTGEPRTELEGHMSLFLELNSEKRLGEKQIVLMARIRVEERNSAYAFLDEVTEAGTIHHEYPIPAGTLGSVGIDTVTCPETICVRGGIVFQPTSEGRELSVGNLRLFAEEFVTAATKADHRVLSPVEVEP